MRRELKSLLVPMFDRLPVIPLGAGHRPRKRLELLKEAVPKVARVAVLSDPAAPSSVLDVQEVLPVAARALRLTI